MTKKFNTLQEALDSVHIPPKTRTRGLRDLLKERDEVSARLTMLLETISHTCTHAKLDVQREYCEDDWARQSWYEHYIKCADCGKWFGTVYEDRGFTVKK
jgi:hypothetical protein